MMVMMALVGIVAARYANCRRAQHHIRCVAGCVGTVAVADGTRNGTGRTVANAAAVYPTRVDGQRGRAQRIELVLQGVAATVRASVEEFR